MMMVEKQVNAIWQTFSIGYRLQVAIIAEPLAKHWANQNNFSIIAVTEAVETGGWWIHKSISSGIKSESIKAITQFTRSQQKVVPASIDGFEEVNE
ncbi:MAG: hypothetical protein GY744_00860 [Gammaproteobacteria bacterium]|nr:hypothetical protein [Gammaproteobacteria bacterium]